MRLVLLAAAVLAVVAFGACKGGGNGDGESALQRALRRMVLSEQDLPEELAKNDEKFTTNEELSSSGADTELGLLEEWGRLLGYEATFAPSVETAAESPVKGISVSSALFETAEGAAESFADAVQTAEEKDWAANYAGLKEFKEERIAAEGLADEIVWLRLSGIQVGNGGPDALVTDDLIFFRIESERGFLRVLASSEETDDRAHLHDTVEGWLRALTGNVREALPEFEPENGD